MDIEAAETLANLIGRYGVTVVGLIVVAWGLYRLIKRVLDKNDEREKQLTEKFMDQNDRFSTIGKQFIEAMNKSTQTQTELVETNRMLADEIKSDIANINDDMKEISSNINVMMDRLNRKEK